MPDPVVQPTASQQPHEVGQPLSPEAKAEADLFFAQLEAEAEFEGWKYMTVRVPSYLQEYFLASHPNPTAAPQAPAAPQTPPPVATPVA